MELNTKKAPVRRRFTTRRLALLGLFVALSFVVGMYSFPIFPATPYFKLDFANVFILLAGFLFGPVEGIVVCLLKELLSLIGTSSGGIGELANFLMTSAFISFPCFLYLKKKGLKSVVLSLVIACFIGTAAALIVNRLIIFPMYMGSNAGTVFKSVFGIAVAFNFIKTGAVSLLTVLLYKRLSNLFKKLKV